MISFVSTTPPRHASEVYVQLRPPPGLDIYMVPAYLLPALAADVGPGLRGFFFFCFSHHHSSFCSWPPTGPSGPGACAIPLDRIDTVSVVSSPSVPHPPIQAIANQGDSCIGARTHYRHRCIFPLHPGPSGLPRRPKS